MGVYYEKKDKTQNEVPNAETIEAIKEVEAMEKIHP